MIECLFYCLGKIYFNFIRGSRFPYKSGSIYKSDFYDRRILPGLWTLKKDTGGAIIC